ncbi:hypothetical protein [Dokdonia donghaensis]|uniref:hypothetical protein n=1 Tax=Dokdonia donghaensis TaxID=326320 RepID=UPI0007DC103A|nr:hypothetical protein [Dokdonia donghaensis]ANH61375.1 hypothetical protein I597_2478 [Dokdonia donghaensis DSW-1]
MKFSLSDLWSRLPLLTIFLVALNVLALYFMREVRFLRYVQILTVAIFLLYYHINTFKVRILIVIILGMFLLREISVFYYGNSLGQIAYIILGCLAYGLICFKRLDMIQVLFRDKIAIICTFLFVILNLFMLNELISMVKDSYDGSFQASLIFLLGIIITLLGAVAVLYNQVVNSDRSLTFLFFIFCMIISDVSSLLGYYFNMGFFYYIDFVGATLGLSFFIHTVLDVRGEREDKELLKSML